MVNDDIFIKFARSRGYKTEWPDQVNYMKARFHEVKLGFPGIGNDHVDLIEFGELEIGDIFIYDPYVEVRSGDEAPIMFKILEDGKGYVEGIGCGVDSVRDPLRLKIRWMDIIDLPPLSSNFLVYRVNVRPKYTGGPGYYYFFKSYRDFRL